MPPKNTPAWHTTEDDQIVPIKVTSESHTPHAKEARVLHAESMPTMQKPSMALPAILGIGVVLIGFGWFFDLGDILTGDIGATEKTVTVTADGQFDPQELDVHPGDTVTIINAHEDPQLLEAADERELFQTQVIFDEPFTFTVGNDALGDYRYLSGTLPEDRSVLFHVLPRVASNTIEGTAASAENNETPIPIPFGSEVTEPEPLEGTAMQEIAIDPDSTGPATISIGITTSSASSTERKPTSVQIPTNPYTVRATGADQIRAGALAAAQGEQLHSGAPLSQYSEYRPPVTSSTGPEHAAVLVLILSGLLFAPCAKRMLRM